MYQKQKPKYHEKNGSVFMIYITSLINRTYIVITTEEGNGKYKKEYYCNTMKIKHNTSNINVVYII